MSVPTYELKKPLKHNRLAQIVQEEADKLKSKPVVRFSRQPAPQLMFKAKETPGEVYIENFGPVEPSPKAAPVTKPGGSR